LVQWVRYVFSSRLSYILLGYNLIKPLNSLESGFSSICFFGQSPSLPLARGGGAGGAACGYTSQP
jgi:hypothetical protein